MTPEEMVQQHPYLHPLIEAGKIHARRVFGTDTLFTYEVYTDPDVGGDEQLYVMMQTSRDVNEALALLRTFDETWWLDAMPAANGMLSFALDFVLIGDSDD